MRKYDTTFAAAQFDKWQSEAAKRYAMAMECAAHIATFKQAAFWQRSAADCAETAHSWRDMILKVSAHNASIV